MNSRKLIVASVIIWLVFTITLAVWWTIFGFQQVDTIAALQGSNVSVLKHHRMLLWEGLTLVSSLFLGGSGLIFLLYKELKTWKRTRDFFAAFSHELKTPLANIRLHTDLLKEKRADEKSKDLLLKLEKETRRLSIIIDNSLAVAYDGEKRFGVFKTEIVIEDLIEKLKIYWPDLTITFHSASQYQTSIVIADPQIIELVFSNLFQNATRHGDASEVEINFVSSNKIIVQNNGSFTDKDLESLRLSLNGELSERNSGIGLWVSRKLMKSFGGELTVSGAGDIEICF